MIRPVTFAAATAALALAACGSPDLTLDDSWMFRADSLDRGIDEQWYAPDAATDDWVLLTDGLRLEDAGHGGYDGVAWFSTTFTWDDADSFSVVFDGVDDDAEVWVDGVHLVSHRGHDVPFAAPVPSTLTGRKVRLVVRVTDRGGPGGITGRVRVVRQSKSEDAMRSPFADKQAHTSPDWVRRAIIYEVYLRSFSPEGTFAGLQRRLPELKELGVTVLWLMPIHPIGEVQRKGTLGSPYAVQDFRAVNPEFGTSEDFRRLVDAAHAQGFRLIIDLVANHTAWDNAMLFEHPEWYTRDAEGAIVAPNDDWTDVADLNYDHHELRKYMVDVMRMWVEEYGIDGFRCDVAELVPTPFWSQARATLERVRPVMMLSEGSLPEHHVDAFDVSYAWSTYDILEHLLDGDATAEDIGRILRRERQRFPKGSLLMRFHTNHDKNAWDAPAVRKFGPDGAKLAAVLQYVLPGVPLIYNGEEAGNTKVLPLFEKVAIDWKDPAGFRTHFRTLNALRRDHPWLADADWALVDHDGGGKVLALLRTDADGGLLAVMNFGAEGRKVRVDLPATFRNRSMVDVFTAESVRVDDALSVELAPRGFMVLTGR